MARAPKVKVRIEAKDAASAQVRKSQTALSRLGGFIKTNFAASLLSATAILAGFVAALRSTIRASAAQELAVRKLNAALSPLGDGAASVSKELQEYAASLQQVTMAGDETIIEGQALVASFTKNTDEIKGATKAALDLSAATGQNLQSAFLLLARAAAGETSMLSRYGIQLDESIPKSEKFAAALAKIQEQFGGQAQAQAETYTGRTAQLSNAFGDLKEAVGDSITKNESLTSGLGSMKKIIEGLIPLASRTGEIFRVIGEVFWNAAIPLRALHAATTELTAKWMELSGATDVVGVSSEALEARAKALGISVDDLKVRIEQAKIATSDMNTDLREQKAAAEDAKGGVDGLTTSVSDLASAYEKAVAGTTALGIATSVQLEAQIIKINQELYNQGLILDKNSREYVNMEAVAAAKIEALNARITSLRDGMGDLKKAAEDTTGAIGGQASAMDAAGASVDRYAQSLRGAAAASQEQQQAAGGGGGGGGGARPLFPGLTGRGSFRFTIPGSSIPYVGLPPGGGIKVEAGGKRAQLAADGRIIFV